MTAIKLEVELSAKVAQMSSALRSVQADLDRLSGSATTGFNSFSNAANNATTSALKTRGGLQGITDQLAFAQKAFLLFTAAQAGLNQVQGAFALADQYSGLTARLKLATQSQAEYNAAYTQLRGIARENGIAFGDQVALFNRINGAVRNMGGTVEDSTKITKASALALRLSGASAQEASAATLQFAQALGSGALRGDEFNSLNEQAPALLQAVADGMGTTKESLRSLAEQGKLTSDVVGNSLLKSLDNLQAKAATLPPTVGQAFTELKNATLEYVGISDQATGKSSSFANMVFTLADNFKAVANAALIAGGAIAAVYVSRGIGAATTALQTNIVATLAQRAAMLESLQTAVASTAVQQSYAQANLLAAQATVANASGMARLRLVQTELIGAQTAATAATQAHTAAQAQLAGATGMGAVRGALGGVLGLLGGPVGIIATLSIAAVAWFAFSSNADKAAAATEKAAARTLKAVQDIAAASDADAQKLASNQSVDRVAAAQRELQALKLLEAEQAKYNAALEKAQAEQAARPVGEFDTGGLVIVSDAALKTAQSALQVTKDLNKSLAVTNNEYLLAADADAKISRANKGENALKPLAQSFEQLEGSLKTEVGIRKAYAEQVKKINESIALETDKARASGNAADLKAAQARGEQFKAAAKKQFDSDLQSLNAGAVTSATRLQLAKANADALANLQRDALDFAQKLDDDAYSNKLLSLEQYYDQRLKRTQDKINLERAALQAEQAQAQTAATTGKDANERAQAQVKVVELQGRIDKLAQDALQAVQLAKLDFDKAFAERAKEQADALKTEVQERLKLNIESAQLTGELLPKTTIVAQLRSEYAAALKQFENDPAQTAKVEAIIDIKAQARVNQQSLDAIERAKNAAINPLDAQANLVGAQQQRGAISQLDAQNQLEGINAQKTQALQDYQAKLQELRVSLGDVTGDAEKTKQALTIDAQISGVATSLEQLKKPVYDLGVTLQDSLQRNMEGAVESLLTGSKSAKQAFGDMAKAIIADIAKVIAKQLVMRMLLGFADGGAVGAGAGGANSNSGNRFADGGAIAGPGGPRDDVIPAWLSNGEHVIDAATVRTFGGHGIFNAMRAMGQGKGALPASVRLQLAALTPPTAKSLRFADGGAVTAPAGGAAGATALHVTQQFNFSSPQDPRSQSQVAAAAQAGLQRAMRRNG